MSYLLDPWLWLAGLTLLFLLTAGSELIVANHRLPRLADCPPASGPDLPLVSAIIPARNEAAHVEEALRSILAQDYPRLEIIVLDDRSTDETGAILDRVAAEHPQLQVVHVHELPEGWLGKNHALWVGAERARGELLLFTDADVVMQPDAVARGVGYLLAEGADHVTVAPGMPIHSLPARLTVGGFHLIGFLFARPHRCSKPNSRCFVGVGAYNLVRRTQYEAAGTHRRIPMRPDDDMRLGQVLKRAGARQRLLVGRPVIEVEWYANLRQMVVGLEKNSFAGADYSLLKVVGVTAAFGLVMIAPWIMVWLTDGPARWLSAANVALIVLAYADGARVFYGFPAWHALLAPVGMSLLFFMLWRATLLTLWRGGISWRGTRYSLSELRKNTV